MNIIYLNVCGSKRDCLIKKEKPIKRWASLKELKGEIVSVRGIKHLGTVNLHS